MGWLTFIGLNILGLSWVNWSDVVNALGWGGQLFCCDGLGHQKWARGQLWDLVLDCHCMRQRRFTVWTKFPQISLKTLFFYCFHKRMKQKWQCMYIIVGAGWRPWGAWSECGTTCGRAGTQRRQRRCVTNRSASCEGAGSESRACATKPCKEGKKLRSHYPVYYPLCFFKLIIVIRPYYEMLFENKKLSCILRLVL